MADPSTPPGAASAQNTGLRDRILAASEELWQKIAAALSVGSRQDAVVLAESDPAAASQIESILAEGEQTLLTSSKGTGPAPGPAEMLYPSMGGGRKKGKVAF
jgi:hypothetical protein